MRERPAPRRLRYLTMKTMLRRTLVAALSLGFVLAPRAHAQSTGPEHTGYDPTAPVGAHDHGGLVGDQLLVIERRLRCNCSCGLDTHSCQFQMQCGTSPGWTERIRRDLEAGATPEAIEASFVADYGMTVLMAPPPQGFNLVGYLLPGMTILLAGALIAKVAKGRMRGPQLAPVTELDDEDKERLRTEMQKLDESESPDW
jgi:cytochrome c-type biogenesis protein CcmH